MLPPWDVACGLDAALGVAAALHRRERTGAGSRISLALENVALATASTLGFLTEAMVNGTQRERIGNSVYGQYGQSFSSSDGVSFMVVTLTDRHFRDLAEVTGTAKAVGALAQALDADFTDEGQRYWHRDVLTGLFTGWFSEHTAAEIASALSGTSLLWDRYRSFGEVTGDERLPANPMFASLHQPGVGDYLAAGMPTSIDGVHPPPATAPALDGHSAAVVQERLGVTRAEIDRLVESGTVATG